MVDEARKTLSKNDLELQPQSVNPSNHGGLSDLQSQQTSDDLQLLKEFRTIMKEMTERHLAASAPRLAEMDRLQIEKMLDVETLAHGFGIEQNRYNLIEWRRLVKEDVDSSRSLMEEMTERLELLFSGSRFEADALKNLATGKKKQEKFLTAILTTSNAQINAVSTLNEFMAARVGRVEVQNGQLFFETQDEVDAYNQYIDEIVRQGRIVDELWEQYQQRLDAYVSNLERFYK